MKSEDIEKLIRDTKPQQRYAHTMNVVGMATELAAIHGVSVKKTRVAALFHDLCKECEMPDNDLSHAGDAADMMTEKYGITDEDILNAVRYHTTGRAGMSRLEMIIFLADTLEPTRTYDGVDRLRSIVKNDLFAGTLEVLKELNVYLEKNGKEPAQSSLEAIEWLENMKCIGLAQRIAKLIDNKMGRDIVILDISAQSSFADYFVNATATNTRMLSTIKDEIDNALAKDGIIIKGVEGKPDTGWILVDCGDVIVNLFLADERGKYQLEKIWSDAIRVDVELGDTDGQI